MSFGIFWDRGKCDRRVNGDSLADPTLARYAERLDWRASQAKAAVVQQRKESIRASQGMCFADISIPRHICAVQSAGPEQARLAEECAGERKG
jgi:hypothetical protein